MNNLFLVPICLLLFACNNVKKESAEINKDSIFTPTSKTVVSFKQVSIIKKGWLDFEFKKAIAFCPVNPMSRNNWFKKVEEYEPFGDSIAVLLNKEQITQLRNVIEPDTTILEVRIYSDSSVERYANNLLLSDSMLAAPADCFYPRHNIYFYDAKGKRVHAIFICFECNRIKATKEPLNVAINHSNLSLKALDSRFVTTLMHTKCTMTPYSIQKTKQKDVSIN